MTGLDGQREAAMRAVLRTISESPSDFLPVFEAIMEHAPTLCDAPRGGLFMCEAGFLQLVAQRGMSSELVDVLTNDPMPLDPPESITALAALERRPIEVEDVDNHEPTRGQRHRVASRAFGNIHTQVCIPILRGDDCLGVVTLYRDEVRPFEPAQIELASAFAEQAAIAIENVRRFNALEDRTAQLAQALERQSATTDILRVINNSPSDDEPVFESILVHATRLCDAPYGAVLMCESGHFRMAAHQGLSSSMVELMRAGPMPIDATHSLSAQAVLEMRPVSVDDAREHTATHGHLHRDANIDTESMHSQISVPLISGDVAIGVISVWRAEVRPFAHGHIDLVSAFAEQGVIAVENVRRFCALEDRTTQLGEAFERQSATSEVLRVISRSPTDSQPVFEAILEKAGHICDATLGAIFIVNEEHLLPVAWLGNEHTQYRALLEREPLRLDSNHLLSRSAHSGEAMLIGDMSQTSLYASQDPYRVAAVDVEGIRSLLCVPLQKDGVPVGAIGLFKREKRSFRDEDMKLVQTFADQAVIAIDNSQLFEAVNARTKEARDALERQTATSEVLRVISESPTDAQPVFEAILDKAARICGASRVALMLAEHGHIHMVASLGADPGFSQHLREHPISADSKAEAARAIAENRIFHVEDQKESDLYRQADPTRVAAVELQGTRTQLCVPMRKGGNPIGVLVVSRREKQLFRDEDIELLSTFADQAVIAIDNSQLFEAVNARTKEARDALERQTATSEVLRVISESPTDAQPVFEAILDKAARICGASTATLMLAEDGHIQMVATLGADAEFAQHLQGRRTPLDSQIEAARAIAENRIFHVEDQKESDLYEQGHPGRVAAVELQGTRTQLCVPMRKGGNPIGVLVVSRHEKQLFREEDIELLSTFADQAVIAIDNSQMFEALNQRTEEARDALERQTATSEILRVISRSPTDSQPVFDAILEKAARICDASMGGMVLVRDDVLVPVAWLGAEANYSDAQSHHRIPLDSPVEAALVIRTGEVSHIEDISESTLYTQRHPNRVASVEIQGIRTQLCIPMKKAGRSIGALCVFRPEKRLFRDEDIELLKTFADQAVIAIDNARLFETVNARTEEVRRALERQTATSEILRVISSSPTDSQPVFEAILQRAGSICGASLGVMFLVRDENLHPAAWLEATEEFRATVEANPLPLSAKDSYAHWSAATGEIVHIEDLSDGTHPSIDSGPGWRLRQVSIKAERIRTLLCIPMRKGDKPIGVLCLFRREKHLFKAEDIELLSTFAEQAVIAIDNVRLFQTLQFQRAELTRSVGELRALGEVGQAVSSTLDLDTVLTTITSQAVELCGAAGGIITEYDEATGTLPIRAAPGFSHLVGGVEPTRIGEGVIGKAAADRKPVHIPDLDAPGAYPGKLRHLLDQAGLKALLAVPLLREDKVLGTLLVGRATTGEFAQTTINLLETFAAQSALAIHNARVYQELEEQGRALDAANRHKSEFLANMSHELRTPLNAVIGFSEVLGDELFGELNEKQTEYVGDIHESGRHLLSLINDILDLSKVEAGHMELNLARFALQPAIDNALTLVSERAAQRGLTLTSHTGELPDEMVGDERKLKQILLNLLSNSIKFTPAGGEVTLTGRCANGWVEIEVKDTGVGISAEEQTRVFDAFQQAGRDYARKAEGTGLGLTLTRQFVELHGGSIKVASAPEQGSTFTIMLPLEQGVGEQK